MMKKLVFFLLLVCVSSSFGQEKKDQVSLTSFEGTWVLNAKASSQREASDIRSKIKDDVIWSVKASSESITINMGVYCMLANPMLSIMTDNAVLTLRPNGEGETNSFSLGKSNVVVRSKTKLYKDKLTREFTTRTPLRPGSKETELIGEVSEKFILSKDGKRLTFETISQHSNIPTPPNVYTLTPVKLVFDRKE